MTAFHRVNACVLVCLLGGWVSAGLAAQQATQRKATLREGPGSFYPVVAQLAKGSLLEVGETRGTWVAGRAVSHSGWLPKLAFQDVRRGLDYAGLLKSDEAVVISSVDIAAATKGAFEAKYSETHQSNFGLIDQLETLNADPALVSDMLSSLVGGDTMVLRTLPRQIYKNNVILQDDAEQLLGRAMAATLVNPGYIEDRRTIDYVTAVAAVVGTKTTRYQIPFRVAVIKDAAVNGFGLPGGYIVITEGLLGRVQSEAELACQLGHEMAHICLFHGLREFNKRETHRKRDSAFAELDSAVGRDDPFAELDALTGDTTSPGIEEDLDRLANTSYLKIIGERAREDELEADLFGVAYAAAAGYDPNAMVTYLERVRSGGEMHDAFRHHPSLDDRIAALRAGIQRFRLARRGQVLEQVRFRDHVALSPAAVKGFE